MKGDCVPEKHTLTLEDYDAMRIKLSAAEHEAAGLKCQRDFLVRISKVTVIQHIKAMDTAEFLQFMTAYEELRR